MIDFPDSTKVHKRLPKEAFYKHLPLSAFLKSRFVSDIDSITVEYSLKRDNLNLSEDADIKEIMLLEIALKKKDYSVKILEAIARQNPHKLIFLMKYGNECQLAVFHSKLYFSQWINQHQLNLSLSGNSLDEIWEDLIRQIAIHTEAVQDKNLTIEIQLKNQDEIERLQKLIKKTEAATWKEEQPKKKFELYERLQNYKKQLKEITDGKA